MLASGAESGSQPLCGTVVTIVRSRVFAGDRAIDNRRVRCADNEGTRERFSVAYNLRSRTSTESRIRDNSCTGVALPKTGLVESGCAAEPPTSSLSTRSLPLRVGRALSACDSYHGCPQWLRRCCAFRALPTFQNHEYATNLKRFLCHLAHSRLPLPTNPATYQSPRGLPRAHSSSGI